MREHAFLSVPEFLTAVSTEMSEGSRGGRPTGSCGSKRKMDDEDKFDKDKIGGDLGKALVYPPLLS